MPSHSYRYLASGGTEGFIASFVKELSLTRWISTPFLGKLSGSLKN
jgi:hypothetical protein